MCTAREQNIYIVENKTHASETTAEQGLASRKTFMADAINGRELR